MNKLLLLLLAVAGTSFAQLTTHDIVYVNVDPTGACAARSNVRYSFASDGFFGCDNGTLLWTAIIGPQGPAGAAGPAGPSGSAFTCTSITFTGTQEIACTHNLNTLNIATSCHLTASPFTYEDVGVNLVTAGTVNIVYITATSTTLDCNVISGGTASTTIATGTTAATGAGSINNLGSITTATCAILTIAATGVATTDVISFSPNGAIGSLTGFTPATTGGLSIDAYPTASNVNFEVCNWTSGSVTPGQIQLNWIVKR